MERAGGAPPARLGEGDSRAVGDRPRLQILGKEGQGAILGIAGIRTEELTLEQVTLPGVALRLVVIAGPFSPTLYLNNSAQNPSSRAKKPASSAGGPIPYSPVSSAKTQIRYAQLGGDAGFIGAAACGRQLAQRGT